MPKIQVTISACNCAAARRARVLEEMLRAEVGHSDESMTDHYSHLAEDAQLRRAAVEQAGFGFSLEKVGHPTQPKPKPIVVKPRLDQRKERGRLRSIEAATIADEARRAAFL
jgi:hypothetical protein